MPAENPTDKPKLSDMLLAIAGHSDPKYAQRIHAALEQARLNIIFKRSSRGARVDQAAIDKANRDWTLNPAAVAAFNAEFLDDIGDERETRAELQRVNVEFDKEQLSDFDADELDDELTEKENAELRALDLYILKQVERYFVEHDMASYIAEEEIGIEGTAATKLERFVSELEENIRATGKHYQHGNFEEFQKQKEYVQLQKRSDLWEPAATVSAMGSEVVLFGNTSFSIWQSAAKAVPVVGAVLSVANLALNAKLNEMEANTVVEQVALTATDVTTATLEVTAHTLNAISAFSSHGAFAAAPILATVAFGLQFMKEAVGAYRTRAQLKKDKQKAKDILLGESPSVSYPHSAAVDMAEQALLINDLKSFSLNHIVSVFSDDANDQTEFVHTHADAIKHKLARLTKDSREKLFNSLVHKENRQFQTQCFKAGLFGALTVTAAVVTALAVTNPIVALASVVVAGVGFLAVSAYKAFQNWRKRKKSKEAEETGKDFIAAVDKRAEVEGPEAGEEDVGMGRRRRASTIVDSMETGDALLAGAEAIKEKASMGEVAGDIVAAKKVAKRLIKKFRNSGGDGEAPQGSEKGTGARLKRN